MTSGAVALVSIAALIATRGVFSPILGPIAVTMYVGIFTTTLSQK